MLVAAKIIFTILLFCMVEMGMAKLEQRIQISENQFVFKFLETVALSIVFGLFLFLILQ